MDLFKQYFTPSNLAKAPWMKWMRDHNGWGEANKDSVLARFASYCHLKWLTVTGRSHAWCSVMANAAVIETGYMGTENAGAVSWRKAGVLSDWVFGAVLPITHVSGEHHVGFFVAWADGKSRLAYVIGGNQSNTTRITVFNLSGNSAGHDQVIPGPRWPIKAKGA